MSSWQSRGALARLLWPLSKLYGAVMTVRRVLYERGLLPVQDSTLPVVVVGNLTVGGTGKTPLCAALVAHFQAAGWRPAIVSRGYGGRPQATPRLLVGSDTTAEAGDEPVMLYRQTGVPVCVCADRAAAVRHVASLTNANIVFSDDGLQHLHMQRDMNIIVLDGMRGLGNQWLLPAGPLRDSARQLDSAGLIAIQCPLASDRHAASQGLPASLHASLTRGPHAAVIETSLKHTFQLVPVQAINLSSGEAVSIEYFCGKHVHAVAGIGHPGRFFHSLSALGILVDPHPLPDHHEFRLSDLSFADTAPVLVTAKDAVKLAELDGLPPVVYEVCTRTVLSDDLTVAIEQLERRLRAASADTVSHS